MDNRGLNLKKGKKGWGRFKRALMDVEKLNVENIRSTNMYIFLNERHNATDTFHWNNQRGWKKRWSFGLKVKGCNQRVGKLSSNYGAKFLKSKRTCHIEIRIASELYTYGWKLAHDGKANEWHDEQNCSDRFLQRTHVDAVGTHLKVEEDGATGDDRKRIERVLKS